VNFRWRQAAEDVKAHGRGACLLHPPSAHGTQDKGQGWDASLADAVGEVAFGMLVDVAAVDGGSLLKLEDGKRRPG
jgi:hypothetical protein